MAGSELLRNITNASLKDTNIFCILLPKLNESGLPLTSDNSDEPACYTLIDSYWHTMQLDNSITFPKFSGASYDDNILADNNDEMERSDAI